jgi:hypothetical protein
VFEYVYFARPDSVVNGRSVYDVRKRMGQRLAIETGVEADVVVPVPDSGVPAAIGYAQQSGLPFDLGIIRNHYVGRTFIQPTQGVRELGVRMKHSPNRAVLEGKRVILIDDSIVRGTTSLKIVRMVREAGAKEVHLRSASPPIKWPDFYGIDMPEREQLLAANKSLEEMARFLEVDSLGFLSVDGLYEALEAGPRDPVTPQFTDHYFTGDYPTRLTDREIAEGRNEPTTSSFRCWSARDRTTKLIPRQVRGTQAGIVNVPASPGASIESIPVKRTFQPSLQAEDRRLHHPAVRHGRAGLVPAGAGRGRHHRGRRGQAGHRPAVLPARRQAVARSRGRGRHPLAAAPDDPGLHLRAVPDLGPAGRQVGRAVADPGGGHGVPGVPALDRAVVHRLHLDRARQRRRRRLRGLGLEPAGHLPDAGAGQPADARPRRRGRLGVDQGHHHPAAAPVRRRPAGPAADRQVDRKAQDADRLCRSRLDPAGGLFRVQRRRDRRLWKRVSPLEMLLLLAVCGVLLLVVLLATTFGARALGFSKADEIAIVFCGSKKSLATGVPMAGILFPGATAGVLVLPLMIFHQIQLMACSVIAQHYAKRPADDLTDGVQEPAAAR